MDMESKWLIIKQDYLQKHIKQLSAVKLQSFQLLHTIRVTTFQFHHIKL